MDNHQKDSLCLLLNTERFLQSCEEVAQQGFQRGNEKPLTSQTFHRYVEILEDKVEEMVVIIGTSNDEWGQRVLDCKRRVDILSGLLEPIVDNGGQHVEINDAIRIMKVHCSSSGSLPSRGIPVPCYPGLQEGIVCIEQRDPEGGKARKIPEGPKASFRPITVSDAAKSRLKKEFLVQESLTDDLVDMASALKESTRGVHTKVQERDALLETTEHALDTSFQGTKESVSRVEKARKKSRMNFCFTMIVILSLVLGCAAMVVFIRVTSLVGYKRQNLHATEL
jgi:hypothetical protein